MWQKSSATIQRRSALQAAYQQADEKLFVAKMTILFDNQHNSCLFHFGVTLEFSVHPSQQFHLLHFRQATMRKPLWLHLLKGISQVLMQVVVVLLP
jgi:hypothetical protein